MKKTSIFLGLFLIILMISASADLTIKDESDKELKSHFLEECTDIIGDIYIKTNLTRQRNVYGLCGEVRHFLHYDNSTKPSQVINQSYNYTISCITGTENYISEEVTETIKGVTGQDCKKNGIKIGTDKINYADNLYRECIEETDQFICIKEGQGDKNGKFDVGEGADFINKIDIKVSKSTVSKTKHMEEKRFKVEKI